MKLIQLSPAEVQQCWADIKHLHDKASWPHGEVSPWVYDVLQNHFGGLDLGKIGIHAVEHAVLCDMVESLLTHARALESGTEEITNGWWR